MPRILCGICKFNATLENNDNEDMLSLEFTVSRDDEEDLITGDSKWEEGLFFTQSGSVTSIPASIPNAAIAPSNNTQATHNFKPTDF
jgi:hypothetical protein